jgi:hypothetical protein
MVPEGHRQKMMHEWYAHRTSSITCALKINIKSVHFLQSFTMENEVFIYNTHYIWPFYKVICNVIYV